ncbi:sensor histidine kinase [Numidum massiliense]|uniref:sensor histidine kinase n=1 Tax=Numidum massiliense TaxID=1522315 RepID=UPI00164D7693|nr:sensor histidine kinase [Numidum massiliense]
MITLVALAILVNQLVAKSLIEKELTEQKQLLESVSRHLNTTYESAQSRIHRLYQEKALTSETVFFLENGLQKYLQHRLDVFSDSNSFTVPNIDTFFKNEMDKDEDIAEIILYSAVQNDLYVYKRKGIKRYYPLQPGRSYIPEVMERMRDGATIQAANYWLEKAIGESHEGKFMFAHDIKDPQTLQTVGKIVVVYDRIGIERVLQKKADEIKGYSVVLSAEGTVLFDSSNRYIGQTYPYRERLHTTGKTEQLEEESYVTAINETRPGYMAANVVPKAEIEKNYVALRRTIAIATAVCIVFAVTLAAAFVRNYSRRTQTVIGAMQKVERGDLSVRIPVRQEDELSQIAASFNQMCRELNRYIDRVYKSEIKQKQAELIAFQAQINPHFLYNTLEAIRMRAISQGATDVGEMIYIMASLFKHLVKDATIVTLREEIENCRRYLKLFRIRYRDKFTFDVAVAEDVLECRVMKLSLQPIIENYIVHGIRLDRKNNRIAIYGRKVADDIVIEVTDNGKGIASEQLAELQRALAAPQAYSTSSLGLKNVNERIKILYGSSYGITVDSVEGKGTTVRVTIPAVLNSELTGTVS